LASWRFIFTSEFPGVLGGLGGLIIVLDTLGVLGGSILFLIFLAV
jgi:hypothetical protein